MLITGLKIHGVLQILQKNFPESVGFFSQNKTSSTEVHDFYQPMYSEDEHKKIKESMVVFNFRKFLKKAESK